MKDLTLNSLIIALSASLAFASTADADAKDLIDIPDKTIYTKIFTTCRIIPGAPATGKSSYWGYDFPSSAILKAFGANGDQDGFSAEIESTIKVVKQASNGDFSFIQGYRAKLGFEGVDYGALSFEVKGRKYLSIQKFIVAIPKPKYAESGMPWRCSDVNKLHQYRLKTSDTSVPTLENETTGSILSSSHRVAPSVNLAIQPIAA